MADNTRRRRAQLNIYVSLLSQFVILICGFIVPRLMIGAFGSEAYGAVSSITHFLAYISLLEGGIGGVARAALYKPLAENDIQTISAIVLEIKRFFRIISYIFIVYVLVLACGFKELSHVECFDWISTFLLVIVISISTFGQYFIGISYSVLLQAAQMTYITYSVNIITLIINTFLVVILIKLGCSIIIVKLVSSCVYVLRPIFLWVYVKNRFSLVDRPENKSNKKYLTQKWSGLGQHLAYFLYTNTDVAVLTIFADLKSVAVYSVYYMVVSNLENLTSSFSTGMEAVFGDMLARNENDALQKVFGYYETLISIIASVLFSVAAVLIVPFIRIYTSGINDVNYIAPAFSIILLLSAFVSSLRRPYINMTIAAGHFKQTQMAAYGEAFLNIVISIILVNKYGLIGVAIGTLCASSYRFIYYVFYLSKKILFRKPSLFLKREMVNTLIFCCVFVVGNIISSSWEFSGYLMWAWCGLVVTSIAICITFVMNYIFYRDDIRNIFNKALKHK